MTLENVNDFTEKYAAKCVREQKIDPALYDQYGVKRGLRDKNGKGVLSGLTSISLIKSYNEIDGKMIPCDGELYYRGYNIMDIVRGFRSDNRFGFEETAYLLLFGDLPTKAELAEFKDILNASRRLPTNFTRDVIMKAPSKDIMNSMTRSILTLAAYDKQTSVGTIENNIRQCMQLVANFPMLAVYGYHAYNHYENDQSMYIHRPDPKLSTAENFLRMLRADNQYTELEARVLDMALILHMEHGGGNNSTFTTRVVTSAGTDTYSAIAAAMSSLKGPKHGGANIKVMEMMRDIRSNVKHWDDEDEVRAYLRKMMDGEVFDHKGLIYGMGHAVYSLSDPRERIFRGYVEKLSVAKKRDNEMNLYNTIEKVAPEIIAEKRHIFKGVSPNVDFYSGFVYEMLGIPMELYTPLFAIARIVGWSAHRLEEIVGMNKIIRPAYKSVMKEIE